MKKFIITISLSIVIPLLLLAGIYIWTDPFRCIRKFDMYDIDAVNREYLSTELFLRNNSTYHYNSFIFASSRGMALNTYQWKQYLPEGAHPFLFQAWSETITGIELKIEYLTKHNIPIDNAIILLDIPGSFDRNQLPEDAMTMKHYVFTGDSKFTYNVKQYFNYIQSPSLMCRYVEKTILNNKEVFFSDTITNDFYDTNRYNYVELPPQDSMNICSELTKRSFIEKVEHLANMEAGISEPLIIEQYESQLRHIQSLLAANSADYHIVIAPTYCYTNTAINPEDLNKLQVIFGQERIHNYTGENEWTIDYNNFADPNHFGLRVGYLIIEDIYKH